MSTGVLYVAIYELVIDLDRRLTVTREEAGARVPHENQAQGVRGGNDASGLVILVWDCPSAQRRAGLRRAAGLSLPLPLLLSRSSYFWPLGIVPPSSRGTRLRSFAH